MIEEAIIFAREKHKNQNRKGTAWPYIVHLYEVAQTLKDNGADEETIIAGILHDTVEDTETTLEEIAEKFGVRIAQIIDLESERKFDKNGNKIPYRERKYEHMSRVGNASIQTKMVNCADKLSNLRSIYLGYQYVGESYFDIFNGSKEDIKWYYGIALEVLSELSGVKMYKDLHNYYDLTFGKNLEK